MGRRKIPDKISQMSTAAIQLGMSYWNYVAKYFPAVPKSAKPGIGTKHICAYCGAEFIQYDQRLRKYCSMECKEHADGKSRRDRKRVKTIPKPIVKTCLMCGKEFVAESYRNKYCGQFCRSRVQSERSLEYIKNRKAKKEGDKSGGQIPGAAEKIARAEQVEAMCAF